MVKKVIFFNLKIFNDTDKEIFIRLIIEVNIAISKLSEDQKHYLEKFKVFFNTNSKKEVTLILFIKMIK
tara:strand:+ start:134 stop:340 length:207 start_codon:yes stop_codon:yes gene_type:complete